MNFALMRWDCYCAFCGSTLGTATVANKWRTAAFRRWRAREIRKADGVNETDEEDSQESEIDSVEQHTYDRDILSEDDLWWTQDVHALCFDLDTKKAFPTRAGRYYGHGTLEIYVRDEEGSEHSDGHHCYWGNSREPSVFPFHLYCFNMFCTIACINPTHNDLLYGVMCKLTSHCRNSLLLVNYGNPGPHRGEVWDSKPGEEFLCAKPEIEPKLLEMVRIVTSSQEWKEWKSPGTPLDLETRVRRDPFANLPYDILYNITHLLPSDSLINLNTASWFVHASLLNNNSFWRQQLRENMPWFEGLPALLDNAEDYDFRKLFLWIAGHFHREQRLQAADASSEETARLIERHADTPRMPLVAYPPPASDAEVMSTVWIRSWAELDAPFALFDAYWAFDGSNGGGPGALVGLAMTFRRRRTLFGLDDSTGAFGRASALVVDPARIAGLGLCLEEMEIKKPDRKTSVRGIKILMRGAHSYQLGHPSPCERTLLVSEGKIFVGVVGQMVDGIIGSLGLLQCARPPMDDFALVPPAPSSPKPDSVPEGIQDPSARQQDVLWQCCKFKDMGYRIWNHSSVRARFPPTTTTSSPSSRPPPLSHAVVPADLIPYEVLALAGTPCRLPIMQRLVQRLSGRTTTTVLAGCSQPSATTTPQQQHPRVLRTVRSMFLPGHGFLESYAGHRYDWAHEPSESGDLVQHWDIDAGGGEIVDRVDVSGGGGGGVDDWSPLSVKICTNRGQEIVWGSGPEHASRDDWCSLEAPLGEVIAGLVLVFGRLSGAPGGVELPELSCCGILTMPLDAVDTFEMLSS